MRQAGVNVYDLAEAIGEATATVLRWFKWPSTMPLESVVDIARVLGVRPSVLF
ncbi:helix-turn-helix domain-containing protein [Rhodococcus tibetensis]|uniref:Helix-turn-helix transcriptional regulator n=1 Tax=Rhodococcus tibetensis TaxID=2965064 RepID=A0ABT1QC55_9NOCA|nr:helix-turn-helix transcriptional regulator [Rhodococcus sp. FXJ9.536]MCQ4119849.1 helix-turn-helix transcriptional regulator [Rhodococcus sp. FXJ9.536]